MPDLAALSNDTAVESLLSSLEAMAFISPVPAEKPYQLTEAPIRLHIGFSGPARGTLELCTSRQLGTAIASAVTGEPVPSISAEDALKELMNVVCGSLLRQDLLPGGFKISLPLVHSDCADDDWSAFMNAPDTVVVDADGILVGIRVAIRDTRSE